jgi:glutaconate CoA-transferase subunit A
MSAPQARPQKVATLEEAAAAIRPGCHLAIGGFLLHNKPSALVRELVRQGTGGLHLYSCPASSYDADLLIGAGLVVETLLAMVSFEYLGEAPRFRQAAETATLDIVLCDEVTIAGGYTATIEGIPYHPVVSARGHDIARESRLVTRYRAHTGHDMVAVSPIAPDVGVIHVQQCDPFGNARHLGGIWGDELIVKASRHVIVTTDELIAVEETRRNPRATTIPGYLVDMVVPVDHGAHPCSSHGRYLQDEAHLREYLIAASTTEGFADYVRRYVIQAGGHAGYLAAVGAPGSLEALRMELPY